MRGVASGGDGNHSGSLPSVGVYLDEQPVTTIGGTLDVHVYDIARIESLAGPQGTLYGASSQAGTIRIITNKPDTTGLLRPRSMARSTPSSKGGIGGKIEGMINIPLSQNTALRVVGFYKRDAGYIDNVPGTRSFCGTPTFDEDRDQRLHRPSTTTRFVKKNYQRDRDLGRPRRAEGRSRRQLDGHAERHLPGTADRRHLTAPIRSVGDLQVQRFYPDIAQASASSRRR